MSFNKVMKYAESIGEAIGVLQGLTVVVKLTPHQTRVVEKAIMKLREINLMHVYRQNDASSEN